jgi:arsenate reductase
VIPGNIERRWIDLKTVLFVCVENSFRSQIAEAYFNKYAPKGWTAISAGIKPADKVHPNAVRLMLEEGIDISHKKPQMITRELQEKADVAVIVCSGALCPIVYSRYVEEWNMPDPANMPLDEARKIRDAIKEKVLNLIKRLAESKDQF